MVLAACLDTLTVEGLSSFQIRVLSRGLLWLIERVRRDMCEQYPARMSVSTLEILIGLDLRF